MKRLSTLGLGVLTVLFGFAALAQAATISGTIRDSTATGIFSADVRLWTVGAKDDTIAAEISSLSDGTYSFTAVAAGSYKVDARPPAGGVEYTDRWYDVAAPIGNGYVGADADVLTVAAANALNGIDITLEAAGGLDGTVQIGATPVAGMQVRVQQSAVPQIFHNDLSQATDHLGNFYAHDLPPALNYQVLVHDPLGANDTFIDVGPYSVTSGMDSPLPASTLVAMPNDPNEPNNQNTDMNAQINSLLFRQTPPQPFTSTGAIISPMGADLDWYCFTAVAGDRYLIDVSSTLKVGALLQEDPWVDPMVSFWSVNAGLPTKLLENDDKDATTRASHLDTTPLTAGGTYCAAVTTFGDTNWSGVGQSAGHYDLTIAMGNRPPIAAATYNALPVPTFPSPITINEGDAIQIDLTYSDPDSDPLTVTADFRDSSAAVPSGSTFNSGGGTGTFAWTASYTATLQSPYTLTLSVADAEFTTQVQVLITVLKVNLPPTTPVLLTPADGGTVTTYTPSLTFQESTDPNDDALVYDLDLTYGDGGSPGQQGVVDGGVDGGPTSWTAVAIPEDTHVAWRARAYDGTPTTGYSAWSDTWSFYVNVLPEPPTTPVLTKPADGDLMVMVLRPALSVDNPTSIDNDPITITFEIATDSAFTAITMTSPAVPLNTQGNSTSWNPTADLMYGGSYYARASATGVPGGKSAYSNVNHFQIKPYQAPSDPMFLSPFLTMCNGLVVSSASGLATIQVGPSTSPEGSAVTIQLQVFDYAQDPATATPLFDQIQPSMSPSVSFNTGTVSFVSGTRYRFRTRAYDGTAYSSWVDCDASFGTGAGDGGSGSAGKTGCSCSTGPDASALALLGVAALVLNRRRREIA